MYRGNWYLVVSEKDGVPETGNLSRGVMLAHDEHDTPLSVGDYLPREQTRVWDGYHMRHGKDNSYTRYRVVQPIEYNLEFFLAGLDAFDKVHYAGQLIRMGINSEELISKAQRTDLRVP